MTLPLKLDINIMISQEEFNRHIKNKDQLYKAFVSNGYFLPINRKNQFVSVKLLKEIYTGRCLCPKVADINFKPCCNPPSAEFLRDEAADLIDNNNAYANQEQEKQWKRLGKHMRKNIPEKQWLLGLLAMIAPRHEVFQKNYMPPKRNRGVEVP